MASIKFIACQARSINHYMNLRMKIMKCCANIEEYFNRQCLRSPKDVRSLLTVTVS